MDKKKLESLISTEVEKYLNKDMMTMSELADSLSNAVMKAYEEEPSRLVAQLDVSDKVFEAIHEMTNRSLEMREEALKKRTEDILNALVNMLHLRECVAKGIPAIPRVDSSTVLDVIKDIGDVFGVEIQAEEILK